MNNVSIFILLLVAMLGLACGSKSLDSESDLIGQFQAEEDLVIKDMKAHAIYRLKFQENNVAVLDNIYQANGKEVLRMASGTWRFLTKSVLVNMENMQDRSGDWEAVDRDNPLRHMNLQIDGGDLIWSLPDKDPPKEYIFSRID